MRLLLAIISSIILVTGSFILGYILKDNVVKTSEDTKTLLNPPDKTLEAYYIDQLGESARQGEFNIDRELSKNDDFASHLFKFEFNPNPKLSEKKITTGVINIPNNKAAAPLVIMIRGYVDQKLYTSGMGTKRVAEFLAKNGYITLAPDFLGYDESDKEAGNIFETRFQTYTTIISLHKSISQIPGWDRKNVFIWAHSNGGQIALTWISAEKLDYPTVLWAPVTKAFPYSVLYYTDESEDGGKLIRKELAKLEQNYEVEKFSFTTYLDNIKTPIQFHQGTADDAIPLDWSTQFVNKLKSQDTDIEYFTYPGDDHNLSKNWETVVERTKHFYDNYLK